MSKKLTNIDPETVVAQFEGHTLFSIFFEKIQVYEVVLAWM